MCACVYVFAKSAYLYDKAKNHNNLYVYVAHLLLLCILFVFFLFVLFRAPCCQLDNTNRKSAECKLQLKYT